MTGKKPNNELPENLILVMGQLLEATTAASEGLKTISIEVQKNAQAIITAANTIELLEERLDDVEKLINAPDNDNNVVWTLHDHSAQLLALRDSAKELRVIVRALKKDLKKLQISETQETATRRTLVVTFKFLGWLIGTVIAVAAALAVK